MSEVPSWVARHKKPGVEVRLRGDAWYAYRYTSVWDKEKKRPRRKTLGYLGRITPQGLVPPKHKRERPLGAILEYGNLQVLRHFAEPLVAPVREEFGELGDSILALALLKMAYHPPLKSVNFRHETSWSHRVWPAASVHANALTFLLREVGVRWEAQRRVFQSLAGRGGYFAMDLTQVFSESENIPWLEKGYNHGDGWPDQLQLLLIHRLGRGPHPVFLKLLPGSVRDVSSMQNALLESGLKDVLLVGDKGLYSEPNVKALEKAKLTYLLALKRNLKFLHHGSETSYTGYFSYRGRAVWWRESRWGKRRVLMFLDKSLRAQEEASWVDRIGKGVATNDAFEEHRTQLGTLALLTNTAMAPEEAYNLYKQRMEIELAFDAFKNTIESDKTYLQSRESVAGYFFISFLALYLYARILNHLRTKKLVDHVSVEDVLTQLGKVYRVQVEGRDVQSEIPKKVRTLIEKLDLPIEGLEVPNTSTR
ncbi:MAG: transposase [bacterium]